MHLDRIIFASQVGAPAPTQVRIDSACFIGFLDEKTPIAQSQALTTQLSGLGLLNSQEKRSGVSTLIGRPITVNSMAEYESLFDGTTRIDAPAKVVSEPLPLVMTQARLAEPLTLVLNGTLCDVELPSGDTRLEDIAAHIMAHCPQIVATVGLENRLEISRHHQNAAGTLSILPHAGLGFSGMKQARARAVPTAMDVAIRQFYVMGGRQAHIISMGSPLALLAPKSERIKALVTLMGALPVDEGDEAFALHSLNATPLPRKADGAASWSGLSMLLGAEEAGMVLMPDLPDLVARERELLAPAPEIPAKIVEFAECLPEVLPAKLTSIRDIALPSTDEQGVALWKAALERTISLVRQCRRDVQIIAAVPRLELGLTFELPQSAFLSLATPYVRTPISANMPGGAIAPDALLAGQIARRLLSSTPFGSAAVDALPAIIDIAETGIDAPSLCRIVNDRGTLILARDVTTSDDPAWRTGTAQRIMARLLREAAQLGDGLLFEPVNAALMHRVEIAFEAVLLQMAEDGALASTLNEPGFSVLCDETTTPQADRERGIVNAEITFRPSIPIEEIRVTLSVGGNLAREQRT